MAAVVLHACTSTAPSTTMPTVSTSAVPSTTTRLPPSTTSTTSPTPIPAPSAELTAAATVDYDGVRLGVCGIGSPNTDVALQVTSDAGDVVVAEAVAVSDGRGVFCWEGPLPGGPSGADAEVVVEPGLHRVAASVAGRQIATGVFTVPEGREADGLGSVGIAASRPRGVDAVAIHAFEGFGARLVGDPDDAVVRQVPADGWAALGSELWVETRPTLHDPRPVEYAAWSLAGGELGRYYEAWDADAEWDHRRLAAAALAGHRPQSSRTMTLLATTFPSDAVPIAQSWSLHDWEPVAESGGFVLAETGEYLAVSIDSVDPPFALSESFLEGFEEAEDGWVRRIDVFGDPPWGFEVSELSADGRTMVQVWLQSELPNHDVPEPPPHDTYDEAATIELATSIRRRLEAIRAGEVVESEGPLDERAWLLRGALERLGVDECCGEPAHEETAATRGFRLPDGTEVLVLADAPDRVVRRRLELPSVARSIVGETLVDWASDGSAAFFCGFSGFEVRVRDGSPPEEVVDELVVALCGRAWR